MKKILEFDSRPFFFIMSGFAVALIVTVFFTYLKGGTVEAFSDLSILGRLFCIITLSLFSILFIKHFIIPVIGWIAKLYYGLVDFKNNVGW